MSNQISSMLSFIFLAFFIIFSAETIAFQQYSAKALAQTNEVAIYIQQYGYDETDNALLEQLSCFDSYTIELSVSEFGFTSYSITTSKTYNSFSSLFDYLSNDVVCQLTIYRKE